MLRSDNHIGSSEEPVSVDLDDGEDDGKQKVPVILKPAHRRLQARRMVLLCIGILYALLLLGAGHLLGYSPTMTAAIPSRPRNHLSPGGYCDAYTETLYENIVDMTTNACLIIARIVDAMPDRVSIIRALTSASSSGENSSFTSSSSSSSSTSKSPALLRLYRQALLFLRRESTKQQRRTGEDGSNPINSVCVDAPEICTRNPLRTITSAATNAMMSARLALWDMSRSATGSAAQAANRLLLGLHETLGVALRESGVLLHKEADKPQEEEKEEVARMCPSSSVFGSKEDTWKTRPRICIPAELVLRRFIRELDYLPELMKIETRYDLPWHMELFHQELSTIVEAVQAMIDVAELILEQWTIDFEEKVCSASVRDDNNGEDEDEDALDSSWCDPNNRNAKSRSRSRLRLKKPKAVRPPQAVLHSLCRWFRDMDNHRKPRTTGDAGTEEAHLRELARKYFRDAAPPLVLGSRRMQRLATSLSALRDVMSDAVARWRAEVEEVGGRTQRCAEWKDERFIAACDGDRGLRLWRRDGDKSQTVALDADALVVKEILEDGMVTTGATEAVLGEMMRAGGAAEDGVTVVGWRRR